MVNNTNKDLDDFQELKRIIFNYKSEDEYLVDNWFIDKKVLSNNEKLTSVAKKILNETYFYSFSSIDANQDVNEEVKKRHLVILKNFDLKNQLDLLYDMISNVKITEDYIKLLKINNENIDTVKKNITFFYMLSSLFSEERFDFLDKMEQIISEKIDNKDLNIFEIKSNRLFYFIKNKNSYGYTTVVFNNEIMKISYDLMFNYTDSKKEYLQKRKIKLPSNKDMEILKNALDNINEEKTVNFYNENERLEIRNGIIKYHYFLLNNKIENKNNVIIRKKI